MLSTKTLISSSLDYSVILRWGVILSAFYYYYTLLFKLESSWKRWDIISIFYGLSPLHILSCIWLSTKLGVGGTANMGLCIGKLFIIWLFGLNPSYSIWIAKVGLPGTLFPILLLSGSILVSCFFFFPLGLDSSGFSSLFSLISYWTLDPLERSRF